MTTALSATLLATRASLLNSKEPTVVASALDRVLSDKSLSDRLCRSGRQRSKLFSGERVAEALDRALSWSSTS